MHAVSPSSWQPGFEQARRDFDRWRRARPRGERIPLALWRSAVDLARSHGVSRTSQALGVDYYSLQRRLAETEARRPVEAAAFVEMSLPRISQASRCQVEICDPAGGKVRVDVSGLSARELASFVRVVSGKEP
jgi:hypothetical protein